MDIFNNHMIISIYAGEEFDEIQHLFLMDESLSDVLKEQQSQWGWYGKNAGEGRQR